MDPQEEKVVIVMNVVIWVRNSYNIWILKYVNSKKQLKNNLVLLIVEAL